MGGGGVNESALWPEAFYVKYWELMTSPGSMTVMISTNSPCGERLKVSREKIPSWNDGSDWCMQEEKDSDMSLC